MVLVLSDPKKERLWAFEHRRQPLLPRHIFYRRLAKTVLFSVLVLCIWVVIGIGGYHWLANLPWVDAFLNAAMIVGGMGPVDPLKTPAAKVFAGIYSIMSGVIFLSIFGLLAAPVFHRFLHKFHLETDDEGGRKRDVRKTA